MDAVAMWGSTAVALAAVSIFAAGCDGRTDEDKEGASTTAESTTIAPGIGKPCPEVASGDELNAAGSIAFVAQRRSGSELVVVEVSTGRVRRVTKQRTPHSAVGAFAWSPDAARIAYSGGTRGWNDKAYDDIWVVAAKGGHPRRLTNSREDDLDPVWSPDGQRLAFNRQDDGYNWIYVVNADGTGLRRLTPNFSWHPAWTRDGRISYLRGNAIWVMNPDGSNKRVLARVAGVPNSVYVAWSSDGTHVAFTTNTTLWVMRADGTGRRTLYGIGKGSARSPTWSSDSRRIAWTQGEGDLEIYVVNRDGSGLRNVTNNELLKDDGPSWSPNGRALTFLRTCQQGLRFERYPVPVVMNVDGTGARRLSRLPLEQFPPAPAWSP